jgi:hypothetical protein
VSGWRGIGLATNSCARAEQSGRHERTLLLSWRGEAVCLHMNRDYLNEGLEVLSQRAGC